MSSRARLPAVIPPPCRIAESALVDVYEASNFGVVLEIGTNDCPDYACLADVGTGGQSGCWTHHFVVGFESREAVLNLVFDVIKRAL